MESERELDLFDFGFDEKGNYINIVEKKRLEEEANWHDYTYEEIIKGHEQEQDFCVCATFHTGCISQYGLTIEKVRKEIEREVKTKCYHYGNMAKGIYAYSFRIDFDDGDKMYWFVIENPKHVVVVRHTGNIDEILLGQEEICYPACEVYMFEITDSGVKEIRNGYGKYKDDIRYKVLCDEFKILEFSRNRIDPKKPPKDFYEATYKLEEFTNYWGE